MDERQVTVDRRALIDAARELGTLAVSLDRLGSAYAEAPPRAREEALALFAEEWDLFGRVTRARRVLHDALANSTQSEEEAAALEEALDDTPYWRPKR